MKKYLSQTDSSCDFRKEFRKTLIKTRILSCSIFSIIILGAILSSIYVPRPEGLLGVIFVAFILLLVLISEVCAFQGNLSHGTLGEYDYPAPAEKLKEYYRTSNEKTRCKEIKFALYMRETGLYWNFLSMYFPFIPKFFKIKNQKRLSVSSS